MLNQEGFFVELSNRQHEWDDVRPESISKQLNTSTSKLIIDL